MNAKPIWFGPADRPLFGWWHTPVDSLARAGVVLCPPIGIEAIYTYFSYRLLADRLARTGFAVLRFDYDGTGDSFGGPGDPRRVAAWQQSVQEAVDVVHRAGVGPVALAGIRMGALLAAAEAQRRGSVHGLVLWDPCLSGTSFLREQRTLRMLSLGGKDPGAGAVEAPGVVFDEATVAALGRLNLTTLEGTLAKRTLVLEHPERPRSSRLARRLDGPTTDWMAATGQGALLDPRQETPVETIDRIVRWCSDLFESFPPGHVASPPNQSAVVGATADGRPVIERCIELGPARLFGIVTETAGTGGPTIVFVNEGNTPHIGQSRLWVDLGRAWAAAGLRVLRWDLSGNGDSGVRPGQCWHVIRAVEAFDDVADAVKGISPDDPSDTVLVGFCSGAYQALEAAVASAPRGICLVNPTLTFIPPEPVIDGRRRARQATRPWFVSLTRAPMRVLGRYRPHVDADRWLRSLQMANWPAAIARRHPGIPERAWQAVTRLVIHQPTAQVLHQVVGAGIDVLVVCGTEDLLPIELGARATMAHLQGAANFRLELLPDLDHAGLIAEQRDQLIKVLSEHVISHYGPPAVGVHAG